MSPLITRLFSAATGDSGRRRMYTNQNPADQVSTAFQNHESAFDRDTVTDTSSFSVGGGQSTTNKAGALTALLELGLVKTGYALHGRRKFRNLFISIENRKGSVRKWYDPHNETEGQTKMKYPYGYIRMSKGMDGDHVDCFIGPDEMAENVYVITTNKAPDFETEDEQKCMLGFDSADEARVVFLKHYTDPRFFKSMTAMPYAEFEKKVLATLHSGPRKIAFAPIDLERHNNVGPTHNQVPGDYLGYPSGSLVGIRSLKGDSLAPEDKICRQFRHMDSPMDATSIDGNTAALPSDPAV